MARTGVRRLPNKHGYSSSVFINAPFDARYKKIFDAIAFTVIDCGFVARCALEIDDGSQVRLEKIFTIIEECRFAVHDISRTQLDTVHRLPRFNMPLELGMFLGAKRFGSGTQANKNCIILDKDRYRYQKFISDISGQDPRGHDNDPHTAIGAVRDWLLHYSAKRVPSAQVIYSRYEAYRKEIPLLCAAWHWDKSKLTFKEKVDLMYRWIDATPLV